MARASTWPSASRPSDRLSAAQSDNALNRRHVWPDPGSGSVGASTWAMRLRSAAIDIRLLSFQIGREKERGAATDRHLHGKDHGRLNKRRTFDCLCRSKTPRWLWTL